MLSWVLWASPVAWSLRCGWLVGVFFGWRFWWGFFLMEIQKHKKVLVWIVGGNDFCWNHLKELTKWLQKTQDWFWESWRWGIICSLFSRTPESRKSEGWFARSLVNVFLPGNVVDCFGHTYPRCSMYRILRTHLPWIFVKCRVNIAYMEHLGMVFFTLALCTSQTRGVFREVFWLGTSRSRWYKVGPYDRDQWSYVAPINGGING